MAHDSNLLRSLAESFNLTYEAFGKRQTPLDVISSGTLTLSNAFQSYLEPAPTTPTSKDAAPYQLLSGTIKATYNSHRSFQTTNNITVAPGMPSGNTGTDHFTTFVNSDFSNGLLMDHRYAVLLGLVQTYIPV